MQDLNQLMGFVVDESTSGSDNRSQEQWCSLDEISSLSQLRTLRLENWDRGASAISKHRRFLLKDNVHLWRLELMSLHVSEEPYGEEQLTGAEEIFEVLCPPPSLENVIIMGYIRFWYPSWLNPSNIIFLCSLKMVPLGLLPNLGFLVIEDFAALEKHWT